MSQSFRSYDTNEPTPVTKMALQYKRVKEDIERTVHTPMRNACYPLPPAHGLPFVRPHASLRAPDHQLEEIVHEQAQYALCHVWSHKLIEVVEQLLAAVADRGFLCAAFKFPRNPINPSACRTVRSWG
jgi:hypothetical protein